MSDRPLKLLLIDSDPIFRLGLRQTLEEFPELEVVAEAETYTTALQILAELAQLSPNQVNLVVLEPDNNRSANRQEISLQLIRQLKTQYPNLPILLLCHILQPGMLIALKAAGVNGYCPKGTSISELIVAMHQVTAGNSYWIHQTQEETVWESETIAQMSLPKNKSQKPLINKLRNKMRESGSSYIKANLNEVTRQLEIPGLTLLSRAILAGRRRELLAAQWVLDNFLDSPQPQHPAKTFNSSTELPSQLPETSITVANPTINPLSPPLLSPRALQATLFASCINKIQFNLQNVTDIPLEIDILREDKKRELLYLVLQKFADSLDELRAAEVELNRLNQEKNRLLLYVWSDTTKEYFGKFSRIQRGEIKLEIVSTLLEDKTIVETVKTEIINKIPLTTELLSYLIFQTELYIDNTTYSPGSYQANEHAAMILENILIHIANAVIQPLLDRLANIEAIKKDYYNRQFLSTRDIERFRNDLSWKYRWQNYVGEAQQIFESRYELFVLAPRGIAKVFVYAPRTNELDQLGGIPLIVTLLLEFRDAATPRLQSLLSFLGNGVVFFLTRIVGRGVGLIVRGVLQGIGSTTLPQRKTNRD